MPFTALVEAADKLWIKFFSNKFEPELKVPVLIKIPSNSVMALAELVMP